MRVIVKQRGAGKAILDVEDDSIEGTPSEVAERVANALRGVKTRVVVGASVITRAELADGIQRAARAAGAVSDDDEG